MSGVEEGRLMRSLSALTIGVARDIQRKRDDRERNALGETELQFQLPVTGEAGSDGAWSSEDIVLDFDYPFYYSPGTRDSALQQPQMTCGAEQLSGAPVNLTATVTSWVRDERDAVVGARMKVGAYGAGEFSAYLHVTFQGLSALTEKEDDLT